MDTDASAPTAFEQRLDAVKDSLRRLLDHASDRASHLKDRTIEVEHRAAERSKLVADVTTSWIRSHPVASAAAAFALGYALIRFARR